MKTLSHYINRCLEHYGPMFWAIAAKSLHLATLFYEIDVNNFGRAMTYLTLVYMMNGSEEVTRSAVRLVAPVLKTIDFTKFKIHESFFEKMISRLKRMLSL